MTVPVACFAPGADLTQVEVPFGVATSAPFAVTFSEIGIGPAPPGSSARCP
jgi:hypothetical protein